MQRPEGKEWPAPADFQQKAEERKAYLESLSPKEREKELRKGRPEMTLKEYMELPIAKEKPWKPGLVYRSITASPRKGAFAPVFEVTKSNLDFSKYEGDITPEIEEAIKTAELRVAMKLVWIKRPEEEG